MNSIITYLLLYIQYLHKQLFWCLLFIAKYIPLKQWAFDDAHSPKYQKFKTDKLPIIKRFVMQDWQFLTEYYLLRYGKPLKPVKTHKGKVRNVPDDTVCPVCGAPHQYIYDNNGGKGQFKCKVCQKTFITGEQVTSPLVLKCPYCSHALVAKKDRKHFTVHKCVNNKCSYYISNVRKLPKDLKQSQRYKYKLRYIYREFSVDFFAMDLDSLPKNASSLEFRSKSAHIMGLCLSYHVNLGLSLRKTSMALKDIHCIDISHTMVANYAHTAATLIKPFVDNYKYSNLSTMIADETYIKVRGIKGYIWFIMDAV